MCIEADSIADENKYTSAFIEFLNHTISPFDSIARVSSLKVYKLSKT